MKIPNLLAPGYLHSLLIKAKIQEQNGRFLTHYALGTVSGLIRAQAMANENATRDSLMASMRIQGAESVCRVYRKMVRYPDFHRQLIAFRRLMQDYGLTLAELPEKSEGQRELKALLALIADLPFTHLQEERFLAETQTLDFSGAECTPGWIEDLHQQRLLDALKAQGLRFKPLKQAQPRTTRFYKALNSRQEAEGLAQLLLREQWKPEEVMIILCNSQRDGGLVRSVLTRYQLPAAQVAYQKPSKILRCFDALVSLTRAPSIAAVLTTLQLKTYPTLISEAYVQYLTQFVFDLNDLCKPVFTHVQQALESNTLLNIIEKENLLRLESQAQSVHEQLLPWLLPLLEDVPLSEKLTRCYELLRQHSCLNDELERRALLNLKTTLEDCWDLLEQPGALDMFMALLAQKKLEISEEVDGRIAITDLKHPLPCRPLTILFGADQNSFPGNIAATGIFDEDYLKTTSMPSQAERYDHYTRQLEWIYTSASHCLIYSYAAGNYEGKSWDVAFEIEQRAATRAVLWPLVQNEVYSDQRHQLSPDTARRLFAPDHVLRGSISSFETYFQCPYAYFLKSGLRLSRGSLTTVDAAITGTIQHALLEQGIRSQGKAYASLSETEINAILNPYFQQLDALFPDQHAEIDQIQRRMQLNLKQLLQALAAMEENTSFAPAFQELRFEEDLLETGGVTVRLNGIIDRIDTCLNDLRILDYKSSAKTLSEARVKAGLQLQLLTYLIIAVRKLGLQPAGAYYCSLKNETISVSEASLNGRRMEIEDVDRDEWMSELQSSHQLKGWTMKECEGLDYDGTHVQGLTCKDGQVKVRSLKDFDNVQALILELYQLLVQQLSAGRIELDPVEGACLFCDFKPVCRLRKAPKKPAALVGKEEGKEVRDGDSME
ncbi:PD-(D/E)XK nuclease family protein [Holdemania sp. 1001302B_160321_E10]|uniref:PD-(D/E)XK nuclease family protein n=1 Tax=Holdemania sp. 1001302B_160321_E10 TaxID=2787120 RepID=UPI001897BB75|nr:PD-(D/E)XK nuclease family protein [Holdemania sp. 1001302B_160321_E10]